MGNKSYVYSARTTERGLALLNKTKGTRSWDTFINEAVAKHYGLNLDVIGLPPSKFLEEQKAKKAAKEAEKVTKAAEKAAAAKVKAGDKAKADKAKVAEKAKADKAKADKAKADKAAKAKADKAKADKVKADKAAKPVTPEPETTPEPEQVEENTES